MPMWTILLVGDGETGRNQWAGLFDLPNLEVVHEASKTKFCFVRSGQTNPPRTIQYFTGEGRGRVAENGRANSSDYAVRGPYLRAYTNVLAPVQLPCIFFDELDLLSTRSIFNSGTLDTGPTVLPPLPALKVILRLPTDLALTVTRRLFRDPTLTVRSPLHPIRTFAT